MIDQAIVLAGGLGTRLRPLTYRIPKALVDINGKPFLQHQLETLRRHGVRKVILCACYLKEQIINAFGDGSKLGMSITFSCETEPLGSAGAVKNAEKLVSDAFFVINGDTYLDMDYEGMADFFEKSGGKKTVIGVYLGDDTPRNLLMDGKNSIKVFHYGATEGMNGTHAGVVIMPRSVLGAIPAGQECSLEKKIFPELAQKGELLGYPVKSRFYDIGTPERLETARKVMK